MVEAPPAVDSIIATAGRSPLVRLEQLERKGGPRLYAKCEFLGPSNSIFDRSAAAIMEAAELCGHLHPGRALITVGGTDASIALALVASASGHPLTVFAHTSLHPDRRRILRDYGATVTLIDEPGWDEARRATLPIVIQTRALGLDLFEGIEIVRSYESIGREIVKALGKVPELVLCGMDLGAVPTGVARGLRNSHMVAVEPSAARIGSTGTFGPHLLGGLAPAPRPLALDREVVRDFEPAEDREAWEMSARLSRETGILAGIASGAVLAAAMRRATTMPADSDIVAVLPDSGERRFMLSELFA